MTWLATDWHWVDVLVLYVLACAAVLLCLWNVAKPQEPAAPVLPEDVRARRERVAHAQAQIDEARARGGDDVIDLAARQFWSGLPHPKAEDAQ